MNDYLINSIRQQTYTDYEIIPLNNKELNMHSASEVLNYGVSQAKGDIIVFSHQDVQLLEDHIFQDIVDFCNTHEFGLAGAAGASAAKRKLFSSVVHGPNKEQAGVKIQKPMIIDTCDECFFFVKRDRVRTFSDLGETWHFYSVEYALQCMVAGEPVYVVPLNIYHLSPGWSLNDSYWITLLRVGRMYEDRISVIATTVGIYRNSCLLPAYVLIRRKFKLVYFLWVKIVGKSKRCLKKMKKRLYRHH